MFRFCLTKNIYIKLYISFNILNYLMKISRPQYGLQQQIVQAIYALRDKKSSDLFREPVDAKKVPDYYQKIKNPMDLTTIVKKLKQNKYQQCQEIYKDLQLIIANCHQYNMLNSILKKADQFQECIRTVWGNFKKQIQKKSISYSQPINVNQQVLKRINYIEQKKNKKKITALQSVIEQQRKNILPESTFLPKIQIDNERNQRQQLPSQYQYRIQDFLDLTNQERHNLLEIKLNRSQIIQQFQKLSQKKLKKYRKIIKKKLCWFDKKIIQKCLQKKRFKKMLVPNHLNALQKQKMAEDLSIRKLQMYIKQITYWIEDNSNILSDYMKDKFVENCKLVRRSILRVIKYRKINLNQQKQGTGSLSSLPPIRPNLSSSYNAQDKEDNDNYENKMKDFKRMLERDRGASTKRDTKIILKNQNGQMQVIDWTSEKKQSNERMGMGGGSRQGGNTKMGDLSAMNENDYNQKKLKQERKRQQILKDEQFIEQYQKKSNALLIGKYGIRNSNEKSFYNTCLKLQIDWSIVKQKQFDLPKQIFFTDQEQS